MANERIPTDPYEPGLGAGPDSGLGPEYRDRPQRLEEDLQIDPELQEGRASGGKIALFALCIAVVLGAVFYGLNNTSVKEAQTNPPAQTAQTQPANPQPPAGMRDVTPKPNSEPGMTTGSSPSRPTPPAAAPTGTDVDRSKQ
jgi:hypothetical protein